MGFASAWPTEEFWDRGARLVFGIVDETMQPAHVRGWIKTPEQDAKP